jgi:hypothetical protein
MPIVTHHKRAKASASERHGRVGQTLIIASRWKQLPLRRPTSGRRFERSNRVLPGRLHRPLHHCLSGFRQSYAGRPLAPPSSIHRKEHLGMIVHKLRLLFRRKFHHRAGRIRVSHGGEDLPLYAKVRMVLVRPFFGAGETQHKLAKLVRCHGWHFVSESGPGGQNSIASFGPISRRGRRRGERPSAATAASEMPAGSAVYSEGDRRRRGRAPVPGNCGYATTGPRERNQPPK